MSPPFVHVAWSSTTPVTVRDTESVSTVTTGADLVHTHTLTASAAEGDAVVFYIGANGEPTFTHSRGDMNLLGRVGQFRSRSYAYYTTVTAGDVTAGTIANTFTGSVTGGKHCISFEVANADMNVAQFFAGNESYNVTAVNPNTLYRANDGSAVIAVCAATPDGGTNGLTVTALNSFTSFRDPYTDPHTGGVHIHAAYRALSADGSVTGPAYANDSTTGPGNVTNPGLIELRPAAFTAPSGIRAGATAKTIGRLASTFEAALPTELNGKLCVMVVRVAHDPRYISTPTGWTNLIETTTDYRMAVFYRVCDGTEGATVSFTSTTDGSTTAASRWAAMAWRFDGVATSEAAFIEAAQATGGKDPPSLTPSWGSAENLWLAVYSSLYSDWTVTSHPTNYTVFDAAYYNPAGDSWRLGIAAGSRLYAGTSDDPGVFTIDAPTAVLEERTLTLALRPAA